jgi:hypothetical protein
MAKTNPEPQVDQAWEDLDKRKGKLPASLNRRFIIREVLAKHVVTETLNEDGDPNGHKSQISLKRLRDSRLYLPLVNAGLKMTGTVTGRISSDQPNISNRPKPAFSVTGEDHGEMESSVPNPQSIPRETTSPAAPTIPFDEVDLGEDHIEPPEHDGNGEGYLV